MTACAWILTVGVAVWALCGIGVVGCVVAGFGGGDRSNYYDALAAGLMAGLCGPLALIVLWRVGGFEDGWTLRRPKP